LADDGGIVHDQHGDAASSGGPHGIPPVAAFGNTHNPPASRRAFPQPFCPNGRGSARRLTGRLWVLPKAATGGIP
jgi:hypothetical protein